MDRIEIVGLRVMTVVGVLAHEREMAQPLEIDIVLESDLHEAGETDDLDDTANYGSVAERAAAVAREAKDLLLERLAQRIADDLLQIPRIDAVEILVRKLRPPIPEDLVSTAVRIRRTRAELPLRPAEPATAYIALGSNLGDRLAYLRDAVAAFGTELVAQSRVFETAPIGGPDGQGPYLNMVVELETRLDPFALLRRCQRIEADALRQRVVRWGPRTLDVDLLLYDDVRIDSPSLTVPHPMINERRFVLAPLSDLAPERCPADWDATLPPDPVTPIGILDELD